MKIQIELTAKQERHLIQLGLAALTAQMGGVSAMTSPIGTKRGPYHKKKWSAEQHEHYASTMEAKWGVKRAEKTAQAAKPNGKTNGAKWNSPEYRRAYGKRYRAKQKAKKTNGAARQSAAYRWSPARRRKYAEAILAKGHKLRKLSKDAKRTNGHKLDANNTTRHMTGVELRHDGQPYKQPGKKWTPEHRRNFVKSYKAAMARKKKLQAKSKKALAKVLAQPEPKPTATASALAVRSRHKASRPNAKWTDEQRARFRATLAAKKAAGWVPKRTRGAQK